MDGEERWRKMMGREERGERREGGKWIKRREVEEEKREGEGVNRGENRWGEEVEEDDGKGKRKERRDLGE